MVELGTRVLKSCGNVMDIRGGTEAPLPEAEYGAKRAGAHGLTNRAAVDLKPTMSTAAVPCDLGVARRPAIMPFDRGFVARPAGIVRNGVTVQIERDSSGIDGEAPYRAGDVVRQVIGAGLRQISASGQLCACRIR